MVALCYSMSHYGILYCTTWLYGMILHCGALNNVTLHCIAIHDSIQVLILHYISYYKLYYQYNITYADVAVQYSIYYVYTVCI